MAQSLFLLGLMLLMSGLLSSADASTAAQPTSPAQCTISAASLGSLRFYRRQEQDCTTPCQSSVSILNTCGYDPTNGNPDDLTPAQQTCLCDGANNEDSLVGCAACLYSNAQPDGIDGNTLNAISSVGASCAALNGGGTEGSSLLQVDGLTITGSSTESATDSSSSTSSSSSSTDSVSSTSTGDSTSSPSPTTSSPIGATQTTTSSFKVAPPSSGTAASVQGTAAVSAPAGAGGSTPTTTTVFSAADKPPLGAHALAFALAVVSFAILLR